MDGRTRTRPSIRPPDRPRSRAWLTRRDSATLCVDQVDEVRTDREERATAYRRSVRGHSAPCRAVPCRRILFRSVP